METLTPLLEQMTTSELETFVKKASGNGWHHLGTMALKGERRVVGAATDYSWTWSIINWAKDPKPGDDVFLDIEGSVQDKNSLPINDHWKVACAVAAVDGSGNPTALKDKKEFPSSQYGSKYPYDNVIDLWNIPFGIPSTAWHAVIGAMPSSAIEVWVELFAHHQDTVAWDWSLWSKTRPTKGATG